MQNLTDETNISKILIGNKSDLESERQVNTDEGIEKAKLFDMAFIETSALNGKNIDDAFTKLINDVYRNYRDELRTKKIKIEGEGTNIFQLQKVGFSSNIDCCLKSEYNIFN
jgi:GTPase SAR1 family protein